VEKQAFVREVHRKRAFANLTAKVSSESKEYFENALKLNLRDSRYKKELRWVNSRIREAEDGVYDFRSMVLSVSD
jgi:hypothetical protein